MEGFAYHLAKSDDDMVAGLMVMPEDCAEVPPFWMIYFGVDGDVSEKIEAIKAAGGTVHHGPVEVPGPA